MIDYINEARDANCQTAANSFSQSRASEVRADSTTDGLITMTQKKYENVILIVHDLPDQLEMMRLLLSKSGYSVLTAFDGRDGFESAARHHPDLIISHISTPRIDAVEMCRLIRQRPDLQMTPLLLVGDSNTESESMAEGLKAGADDFLEAPYDPVRLVAKAARLIERKRVEQELRQSEERYRELVENARDIIYSHDLEGNFLSINKAGEMIFGYTREEILGMNIAQVIAPEHVEKAREMMASKLDGEEETVYELDVISKDGRRITVEVSSSLIFQDGLPVGVQGIARDMAERRQMEERLRQSQKMETIGRLAGGIAHDFNNLLTVITGYSDLAIKWMQREDPLRHNMEEIKKASDRAISLTRQLLAFSRKQTLQPVVLDLNKVISDMEEMLRHLIGENIELKIALNSDAGSIKAPPCHIEQVIMNLAINARDAMPDGGNLIIQTDHVYIDEAYAARQRGVKPGHYVMLAVSDTGTGMDEGTQSHIFDLFFTTKEQGKGTGLGLSTVYGIVNQSGGHISVYSEVGAGTIFMIYLPRVDEEARECGRIAEYEEAFGDAKTILLVEEDETLRNLVREALISYGYEVLEATDGKNALSICERHEGPIDLLLADLILHEVSGRELANRLTQSHPEMKVLYICGYAEDATMGQGTDSDMRFIQKPFLPIALARKVREAIDQAQSH